LWWRAQIPRFKLARDAICAEIENPFTREVPILGAIPANFLAGCKHHGVIVFLDLTLELAFRRSPEHQRKGINLSCELHQGTISTPQRLGKTDGGNRIWHRQILLQLN
jgi:hypothetical protein